MHRVWRAMSANLTIPLACLLALGVFKAQPCTAAEVGLPGLAHRVNLP